jgi:hypothetical protein
MLGLIALGGYAGATAAVGLGALTFGAVAGALLGAAFVVSFVDLITPEAEAEIKGVLTTRKGAVQPLQVIYGRREVAGGQIFLASSDREIAADPPVYEIRTVIREGGDSVSQESVNVFAGTAAYTLPNAFRWVVYQLADGDVPIEGLESIYINDELLVGSKYEDWVSYRFTDGSHTSQPFTDLAAAVPGWTSDHLILGTVGIAIRMEWNKDIFEGVPKFTFVLKGTKLLDLDALPTQTRRYSNNPAEAQFDYLINPIYGKGLSPVDGVDLSVASFIAARDYANDPVIAYSGGPQHTRMSSNAVLTAGSTVMDNMRQLLVGCRGTLPYINGVFNLMIERDYAFTEYKDGEGADYSEFFDFNEDNIIGSWKIKAGDIATRYNQVKVIFPNEAKHFESDFVTVYSNTFRAEDGRLLEKTFTLTGVTNAYQATDTANVIMRKSRQQIDASFMSTPRARNVTAGEIVTITHATPSWSLKKFRVSSIVLLATGNCSVTVAEHEPTVYDLTVPNEIATSPDTDFPDPTIVASLAAPTLVSDETVLKTGKDGTLTPQLKITWVAPIDPFVVGYDVQIKDMSSTDLVWQTVASPNSIDSVTVTISGVEEGIAYDVRVRARNSGGWVGAWATTENHTIIGQTSLPSNVPNFYISGSILSWEAITDSDRAGYVIRFQPGVNRSWGDANPAHDGIVTESPHDLSIDIFGQNTLMIKAVDRTGNYSETPASIITDFGNPLISNVFEEVDDHALGFTGTITGAAVVSGDLKADSQTPVIWGNALSNMYTSSSAAMYVAVQYAKLTYLRTITPSFSASGNDLVIESTIAGTNSQITYRPEAPDLMWESLDTQPMWQDEPISIVVNGDFAIDHGWTQQSGWTIADGKASRSSGESSNTSIQQTINIVSGTAYTVSYDRTYISGNGQTLFFSEFLTDGSSSTLAPYTSTTQETVTVTGTFTPTYSGAMVLKLFGIGDFEGSVDNVVVKTATGSTIVDNGDFSRDVSWDEGSGWSIGGGDADRGSGESTNGILIQTIDIVAGTPYIISYDRTYISGDGRTTFYSEFVTDGSFINLGDYDDTTEETVTVTDVFTPAYSGSMLLRLSAISDFTGSIDNIEVIPQYLSYATPPPYAQWPGRFKVTAQPYNFKFGIAQGFTRGVISELNFKVDALDITETLADVAIDSGGTRLSLTKTYSVIKSVNLTLQDDGGTAATVKVMDKNATTGPLIQGYDSSDSATGCNVDATIIGY